MWQKPGLTRVTQTPQAAAPRIAREPLLFGGFMRSDGVGGEGGIEFVDDDGGDDDDDASPSVCVCVCVCIPSLTQQRST